MTFGEFLTQYAGAFFGFLGAALAAGLACVGSAKGTGCLLYTSDAADD